MPSHCVEMAAKMRAGDRAECEAVGMTVRKAVWRSYRRAVVARVAFMDGELAALFGLGGGAFGATGTPWMFTTPVVERHKLAFLRGALATRDEFLLANPILENWVHAEYGQACRLLLSLGFTLSDPAPFGPKGALFRKFRIAA